MSRQILLDNDDAANTDTSTKTCVTVEVTTGRLKTIVAAGSPTEIRAHAWELFRLAGVVERDGADDPTPTPVDEEPQFLGREPWLEVNLTVDFDWQTIGLDKAEGEWQVAMIVPTDGQTPAEARAILEANMAGIFLAERYIGKGL